VLLVDTDAQGSLTLLASASAQLFVGLKFSGFCTAHSIKISGRNSLLAK